MGATLVRVAAIGPRDLLLPVLETAAGVSGLAVTAYGYDNADETPALVLAIRDQVDGFLFNGPVPARLASPLIPHDFPQVTVRYDTLAVASALFRIRRDLPEALEKGVSLDSLGVLETAEIADDLGLEEGMLHRFDFRCSWSTDSVTEYHRELLATRKVAAAAVGLRAAYRKLLHEGWPVYNVRPTKFSIRNALAELVFDVRHWPQTVEDVSVIHIALVETHRPDPVTAWHAVQESLRSLFVNRRVSISTGVRGLSLLGDRHEMTALAESNILYDHLRRTTGIPVRVGCGVGPSVPVAHFRASLALDSTDPAGGMSAVVSYYEEKLADELNGPKASVLPESPAMRLGASTTALRQASEVRRRLGKSRVTAHEVAAALDVSPRTGRRLLLSWNDCGLAELVGGSRRSVVGRPRGLYELRL